VLADPAGIALFFGDKKMGVLPVLALTALLAAAPDGRAGTNPSAESVTDGLACFENLNTPEYPRVALQSHVDGSIWTWTTTDAQGGNAKIETQVVSAWSEAPKLLAPAVEKAIHAARVKPDCAGKKVWVVFRYDVRGDAVSNPKVTSRQDGPNVMWIEGQPAEAESSARRRP
jgi:hypothetical protein